MNTNREAHCYALRRLNPFLGVIQVIETSCGRASSSNGLVWDIQILSQSPADWGSLGSGDRGKAWYRREMIEVFVPRMATLAAERMRNESQGRSR